MAEKGDVLAMPTRLMRPANGRWRGYTDVGEVIVPSRVGAASSFLGGWSPALGFGAKHPAAVAPTATKMNSRYRFQALQGVTSLRVALGNYAGHEETFPDFSATFTATVEKYGAFTSGGNLSTSGTDPNETFYRLTFGGSASVTVSPREKVLSDALALTVPQGGYIYVRVYCTIPATTEIGIPVGKAAVASFFEFAETGGSTVDKTGGGQLTASGSAPGPTPLAVVATLGVGVTETRRVAIVGDSISFGTADANGISYVEQALTAANIPHYHVGRSTSTAALFLDADKGKNRRELIGDSTSAICEYGANDIGGNAVAGSTYTSTQQQYMSLWQQLATTGLASGTRPVWQTTVLPRMTSASSGATPTTGSSQRTAFNDWLRAGAPADGVGVPTLPGGTGTPSAYLTGIFDTADTVEADVAGVLTRNGTYFKDWTTTTVDGLHPSTTGHALIRPGIVTASLT